MSSSMQSGYCMRLWCGVRDLTLCSRHLYRLVVRIALFESRLRVPTGLYRDCYRNEVRVSQVKVCKYRHAQTEIYLYLHIYIHTHRDTFISAHTCTYVHVHAWILIRTRTSFYRLPDILKHAHTIHTHIQYTRTYNTHAHTMHTHIQYTRTYNAHAHTMYPPPSLLVTGNIHNMVIS